MSSSHMHWEVGYQMENFMCYVQNSLPNSEVT
uniref:Uncharacterized protein n=1 Tax=Rhizophora mucronata TaxID=61149 RepID=A0A2P2Q2G3_RHIMU